MTDRRARIGAIVLNVRDRQRAARFWARALGYEAVAHNPDFLADPRGLGPRLHLDENDRTHLDLWTDDAQAEIARLVALGATVVPDWTYPPDADFTVLADTEGNLFCVIDTSGA